MILYFRIRIFKMATEYADDSIFIKKDKLYGSHEEQIKFYPETYRVG